MRLALSSCWTRAHALCKALSSLSSADLHLPPDPFGAVAAGGERGGEALGRATEEGERGGVPGREATEGPSRDLVLGKGEGCVRECEHDRVPASAEPSQGHAACHAYDEGGRVLRGDEGSPMEAETGGVKAAAVVGGPDAPAMEATGTAAASKNGDVPVGGHLVHQGVVNGVEVGQQSEGAGMRHRGGGAGVREQGVSGVQEGSPLGSAEAARRGDKTAPAHKRLPVKEASPAPGGVGLETGVATVSGRAPTLPPWAPRGAGVREGWGGGGRKGVGRNASRGDARAVDGRGGGMVGARRDDQGGGWVGGGEGAGSMDWLSDLRGAVGWPTDGGGNGEASPSMGGVIGEVEEGADGTKREASTGLGGTDRSASTCTGLGGIGAEGVAGLDGFRAQGYTGGGEPPAWHFGGVGHASGDGGGQGRGVYASGGNGGERRGVYEPGDNAGGRGVEEGSWAHWGGESGAMVEEARALLSDALCGRSPWTRAE